MYDYLLFDLDGTVVDSGLGVTNSVMYALKKWGIEVKDRKKLYVFLGPPLVDSFSEHYGFSHEDSLKCVEYYREYYNEKGIFENTVYDGIVDVLVKAREMGKKIILATSKPEEYAKQILEYLDLLQHFDFVAGATMDESRNEKAGVIRYALESLGITDPSDVVMIGDRKYDVVGSREYGFDCVGVLFGFGSREELESVRAAYIVETVAELGEILQAM
jgi:phosphoglycolate phosphatase